MSHSHRTLRSTGVALAVTLTLGLLGACGDDDDGGVIDEVAAPTPVPSSSVTPVAPTEDPGRVNGKGFRLTMPGEPEKSTQTAGEGRSKLVVDVYTVTEGAKSWTATRAAYPKSIPITLRGALDGAATEAAGELAGVRTFRYRGEDAIEGRIDGVRVKGKEASVFARYVLVGRVLYGLVYVDKKGGPKPTSVKAFVDSLRFT
ncbi:MAG: hypothetical protein ACT4P1_01925 [Sporichthyaceae bacterium]